MIACREAAMVAARHLRSVPGAKVACFVNSLARMDSPRSYQPHPMCGPLAEAIVEYARHREQNLMSHEIQQLCFFAHELCSLLHAKSCRYLDEDIHTMISAGQAV